MESSAIQGASLLGGYTLGLGVPFLLASILFSRFIRLMSSLREHFAIIERVIGVGLLITGMLFWTGGMPQSPAGC